MYYTYEWFALNDFIDSSGGFHLKDSVVYVGSGSKGRYKSCENYNIRSSRNNTFVKAFADSHIESKILKCGLTKESSIFEEQVLYDELIAKGYGNSSKKNANKVKGQYGLLLFNATRPFAPKTYEVEYFEKYLELSTDSKSGLIWRYSEEPYYKKLSKTPAGTLNNSGYWVVNIKKELWHCHRIVELFQKLLVPSD